MPYYDVLALITFRAMYTNYMEHNGNICLINIFYTEYFIRVYEICFTVYVVYLP